ncbi:MAG TPA: hypothetical protein VGN26_19380 [Armatimonadota bacterium]|jgi:restriction system protein
MPTVPQPVVWGIHGGKDGAADSLFLREGCIALGWDRVGDLTDLPNDREVFKTRLSAVYPEMKPGAIPLTAGQLYRFVYEMADGDLVAYPSVVDRQIHIGKVEGGYQHIPSSQPVYPNIRRVKWRASVARTSFTQGALYEIGSAMSLFQIRNYYEEFVQAHDGMAPPTPMPEDSTAAEVSQSIEEGTRDFVLKRLSQELKGHPLTDFVAHLLGTMGYRKR